MPSNHPSRMPSLTSSVTGPDDGVASPRLFVGVPLLDSLNFSRSARPGARGALGTLRDSMLNLPVPVLVLIMAFGVALFILFRYKRRPGLIPERNYLVSYNESGITCAYADGNKKSIPWLRLRTISVKTNDTGPWGMDVFYALYSDNPAPEVIYPGGATGEIELLRVLQGLPGFNNDELCRAMGCTDNATFICWQGKLYEAPPIAKCTGA